MPIDTSIYDQIKTPKFLSPQEKMSNLYALQNAQQQNQLGAAQVQQAQMGLRDQSAIRQAITESAGNLDQVVPLAAKYGASGNSLLGLQKGLIEQRQAALGLKKNQLEVQGMQNDKILGAIDSLPKDPQQLAAALPQAVNQLASDGYINPQQAQALTPEHLAQMGNGDPVAGLQFYRSSVVGHKQIFDEAMKQKEVQAAQDTASSKMQSAKTQADEFQAKLPGIQAGNIAAQQKITGQEPLQPKDKAEIGLKQREVSIQGGQLGIAQQKLAMERKQFDMTYGSGGNVPSGQAANGQPTGEAYLQTLAPAMQATVKAITDGRQAPVAATIRGGQLNPVMAAVNQYDPTWSEQRGQLRSKFSADPTVNALNTAVVHAGQFEQIARGQNNSAFQPGNKFVNNLKTVFGSAAPTNAAGMENVLSGEVAQALKKSGATDTEIENVKGSIHAAAQSPDQLAGIVRTVVLPALGAKLNSYGEQYKAQGGNDKWSPVFPTAQKVLDTHGVKEGAGASSPTPPTANPLSVTANGKSYTFKSPALAAAFRKEAAAAGHRVQ